MAMVVEVVLVNGERRMFVLPGHTGSVANALSRLEDWVKTDDGGWVQKSFIVEVRLVEADGDAQAGSNEELDHVDETAEPRVDQGRD